MAADSTDTKKPGAPGEIARRSRPVPSTHLSTINFTGSDRRAEYEKHTTPGCGHDSIFITAVDFLADRGN
jgi:hypothetical protein